MEIQQLAFKQLRLADGSWGAFCSDWSEQCRAYEDALESYGEGWLQVLQDLAKDDNADARQAGIFALVDSKNFHRAVCQVNCAEIKGYDGPVIRVRHIILCPDVDYGQGDITTYGAILSGVFFQVYALSQKRWLADHIKFHLRSPADQNFFAQLGNALADSDRFSHVDMRGAWLYVTK